MRENGTTSGLSERRASDPNTRLRRTMLYVPGNNPAMIQDAGVYGADSLMFDLEDSVSAPEKDAARLLVFEAVRTVDFGTAERVCRINSLHSGLGQTDIAAMVCAGIDVIRLPKTETASDIADVDAAITAAETCFDIPNGRTRMMGAIESARGVLNAVEIATASPRLIGIALGAEDYVTDMKTRRHANGIELAFARNMVLHAARAAGIAAFDTVYSDVENDSGFRSEVELIHALGYDGKSCVNPRQVPIVNEIYTPSATEIEEAQQVMAAIAEAHAKGSGVISAHGKMVDKPIVARAERILTLAQVSTASF